MDGTALGIDVNTRGISVAAHDSQLIGTGTILFPTGEKGGRWHTPAHGRTES